MVYKITNPNFIKLVEKGIPLAELEKRLKPGASSSIGFIGKDEDLLKLINSDWETIENSGRTHDDLANAVYRHQVVSGYEFLPLATSPGAQDCPWGCPVKGRNIGLIIEEGLAQRLKEGLMILASYEGDISKLDDFCNRYDKNKDLKIMLKDVKNYLNDRRPNIILTDLLPHLICAHYFFEGRETPYRADPKMLIKAFGLEDK